ncbi:MAG: 4Fe-4S binding protein [Lachnospiraceae bacterium]|nr:4Fe-4S binding protein [Lachnospiraceae bacterium]
MARVITDKCVACGTCAGECPVNAISKGDGKYEIAADTCVDCGACENACPTGAITGE